MDSSTNILLIITTFSSLVELSNGQFYWSSAGPIAGKVCTQWLEAADLAGGWDDNYLCADEDWGIQWKSAGPIAGMRCTQIVEAADPFTWKDNYLCVPSDSPITFTWSSAGPHCGGNGIVQILEPSDPHTWKDNYLCWTFAEPQFYWSSAGPIANKVCVQWLEAADLAGTWGDNYLCSDYNWGIQWNSAGPIAGMRCTQIVEPADPNAWGDNYLCVPPNSPITFAWSPLGPVCIGDRVVQIHEAADPHSWNDNYLCWTFDLIYGRGCYTDTSDRALRTYKGRSYTIQTCSDACSGYTYFSIQDGDQCFCENDWLHATKYGVSTGCNRNGLGGSWANNIYVRHNDANIPGLPSPYSSYYYKLFGDTSLMGLTLIGLCVFTLINFMVCIVYCFGASKKWNKTNTNGYDKVDKLDIEVNDIDSDIEEI